MDGPPNPSRLGTPSTRHTPRQKLRSLSPDWLHRSIVARATRTGLPPSIQRGSPPRNCGGGRGLASASNPTAERISAPAIDLDPAAAALKMGAMRLLAGCGPCIHAVGHRSCPKCAELDYVPRAESWLARPKRERSKLRCVVYSSRSTLFTGAVPKA